MTNVAIRISNAFSIAFLPVLLAACASPKNLLSLNRTSRDASNMINTVKLDLNESGLTARRIELSKTQESLRGFMDPGKRQFQSTGCGGAANVSY